MITLKNLTKSVIRDGQEIEALSKINLQFGDTGLVAIKGGVRAGKTCLLRVLAQEDTYNSGNMFVDGVDIGLLTDKEIQNYRTHYVGMVTSQDDIMPNLTLAENMSLGTAFGRIKPSSETLAALYTSLGLLKVVNVPAHKCSKEERICAGFGRLLIKSPKVMLIDDIDSGLDVDSSLRIWRILKEASETHLVIVVSDSDPYISKFADRVITMDNGKVTSDVGSDKKTQSNVLEQSMIDKSIFVRKHRFTFSAVFKTIKQMLISNYKSMINSMVFAFLLVIGFVLSSTLCTFNTTQTIAKSSKEHGDKYIEFYKEADNGTREALNYDSTIEDTIIAVLQNEDLSYFCAKHEINWQTNILKDFQMSSLITNSEELEKGQTNKFNQKILAGNYTGSGAFVNDESHGTDVVISDYVAELIIKYGIEYGFPAGQNLSGGFRNVELYEMLVSTSNQQNVNFEMNGTSYNIVGIYETDFDNYVNSDMSVKSGMEDIFEYNLANIYSVCHVNTNFYTINARREGSITIAGTSIGFYSSAENNHTKELLQNDVKIVNGANDPYISKIKENSANFTKAVGKTSNYVYVSWDIMQKMISSYLNTNYDAEYLVNNCTSVSRLLGEIQDRYRIQFGGYDKIFNISAIIPDVDVTNTIVVSGKKPSETADSSTRSAFEYLYLSKNITTNGVVMPVGLFNVSEIENCIKTMNSLGYTINTLAGETISGVSDTLSNLRVVFIIVALGVAVCLVLLMISYIRKLYMRNTRTIGLLRSYGCTKYNISFTITLLAMVSVLIAIILGTFVTWLFTLIGNALMMSSYVFAVSIFSVNMLIVSIFAICILGSCAIIAPYVCDKFQNLQPIYMINYEKTFGKKSKKNKNDDEEEESSEDGVEEVKVTESKESKEEKKEK